ncbi:hypothetical protein PDJ86_22185 [Bacillus cereus group sp. TH36-2LC]|uniref:hypothetical protein n=1 Tax=Bacillus cereus group sp. TH36-2LC TaxID=3018040 RepID=UPI0022DEFFDD|nr:hypothetical protein [Bacillus cereus group sp. TH36-2LC]MDA1509570.1 hypothetical protein [Bacillus cereus group sp. TH36-2LC]
MASNLADILVTLTLDTSDFSSKLREVGQELNNFRNHMQQVTTNMENDFSNSMSNMGDSMNSLTQATQSTSNSINQHMNTASQSVNRLGQSSRSLARNLGTDMESVYRVVQASTQEFERFGQTGNRVSMQVAQQFQYLPRHLQLYVQRLQEAGQSTQAFGRLNEMYGQRNLEMLRRQNDYMQQTTMQSTRMIQALRDQDIQPLSQQFLRLGERLEANARRGTALNLALTQLGENASPKAVSERVKLIEQGLTRATSTAMLFGIATAGMVYGLVLLSNEVDGRLVPAFDQLKSTWADALTPFVQAFTTFVLWIMKGAQAVGEFMKSLAETNPQLSQMIWGFLALTIAFTALLAPLAICIGLTDGLAASFTMLWAVISPFVLGFLAVVGVAMLVAGAIVVVVAVINNLWTASESFRQAWITIWQNIKDMFMNSFVAPISQAWATLSQAFSNLIAIVTGGAGTMGNLWTWLGDHLSVIITQIAGVVLPILNVAFQTMGTLISAVIQGIAVVLTWMGQMWQQHGDQISAVCSVIWSYVMQAFSSIASFIMSIMPQIISVASSGWELIKTAVDFCMKYIAPVVVSAFNIIWNIIQMVMPIILQIIVSTWNNIKSAIQSAINIIQNVIQLFTNVLKGNWSGAWNNIKEIVSNALTLVWNLIQIYFAGKLLAPLKGFATQGLSIVKACWTGILNAIKSVCTSIASFMSSIWNAIASGLRGNFSGILSSATSIFNSMRSSITSIFNGIKSTATSVFNAVKTAITNPIETAKNTLLGIISKIVSAFASMKIVIPKPKLPKVDIGVGHKSIGGIDLPYPTFSVSWNAKGNIFNGASILGGGQGVGEAGAEAVIPLERKRYMKPYATAVAQHIAKMTGGTGFGGNSSGGNQYTVQFNEPVVIREDADIQRIVDEMERRRKISERSQGVFSY